MTTEPRSRDRATTEDALIQAARDVLAQDGFQGLGVNAIARKAGADKQLIYRYFGGVDGLVDAIGARIADDLRARLQPLSVAAPPSSYGDLVERMVLGFLDAIRGDALMQKIMVWEIASPSELVQRLTLARSKGMMAWVAQMRGELVPPPGVDVAAATATLLAAVQHLVLSAAAVGQFAGLPLKTDADWDRVRGVVRAMVAAIYAP